VNSTLPVQPHQDQSLVPQLLSTIDDLNTVVTDFTTAVNNLDGSLLGLLSQALAVVKTKEKLDLAIMNPTSITEKSTKFSAEESTNLVYSLAGGIGPIQASLEALTANVCLTHIFVRSCPLTKSELYLQEDSHSFNRLLDLRISKMHTNGLIDALHAKVTADNAGLLGLGKGILGQSFDDIIAVYSTRAGQQLLSMRPSTMRAILSL
jgi:hypothetical protein